MNKSVFTILYVAFSVIVFVGCSTPRTEVEAMEESNSKPVALSAEGAKVKLSDVSPEVGGLKCRYIREIGNPGIREIHSDQNDFRNFAATVGGNYLHYVGLTSKAGITYTSGQIYACP